MPKPPSPKGTELRESPPPDPTILSGDVGPYGDGPRRVKVKSKVGESEGYMIAGGNEDKSGTGGRGRRGKGGRNLRGPGVGGWLYEKKNNNK